MKFTDGHFIAFCFIGMFCFFMYGFFIYIPNEFEKDFVKNCIDNSGVPVKVLTHVKGYKDGRSCVEPSKLIETEKK